jgi:hypothetical protein
MFYDHTLSPHLKVSSLDEISFDPTTALCDLPTYSWCFAKEGACVNALRAQEILTRKDESTLFASS